MTALNSDPTSSTQELSFRDLVLFFYKNKIWYVLSILFGLILGVLAFFALDGMKKIDLRIYPVSQDKLATINQISQLTNTGVGASLPMDLFYQTLQNRTNLSAAIISEAEKIEFEKNEIADFLSRMDLSRRIPIPDENEATTPMLDYIDVSLKSKNSDEEIELLLAGMKEIEHRVSGILSEKFLLRISEISEDIENQKKNIAFKIENERFAYHEQINVSLSSLKENIRIAKKLGIKNDLILNSAEQTASDPTSQSQPSGTQSASGASNVTLYALETSSIPAYYRGYEALQTQHDLIAGRTEIDSFIPKLVELKSELNILENIPTVDRLKTAYEKSIIGQGSPVVLVDKNNVIVKRQIPLAFMLGFPIMVLLMITTLILVIRAIIGNRRIYN